jgi:hypothetical protein
MHRLGRLALLGTLMTLIAALLHATLASAGAAGAAEHTVSIEGERAVTFPRFSQTVDRYAIRPGAGASGELVVRAATSDPAGTVRVNGRTVHGGVAVVDRLEPGDEISILIDDSAGSAAYSYIVLPSSFPILQRTTPGSAMTGEEKVLLTLGKWIEAGPFFEAVVDENGVPAHVFQTANSMDFRKQPNGSFSVARGGANGADIVELDAQFREVRRLRTNGLVHTDGHDAILQPDGSAYLRPTSPTP